MANKVLNGRIKLKIATTSEWTTANTVLLSGEIGIEIKTVDSKTFYLAKSGDGTSTWSALPYIQAPAADVYEWAKAATKPTYSLAELGAAASSHTHPNTDITGLGSLALKSTVSYSDLEATLSGYVSNAIKKVAVSGNVINFYKSATGTGTGDFVVDFPTEYFLDQTKTTLVTSFAWSLATYPGSTNPSLDGKPVMILAVKGVDYNNNTTITYSFIDMVNLVTTIGATDTNSMDFTVTGNNITANVKVSAQAGNKLSTLSDGLFVTGTTVASSGTNGNIKVDGVETTVYTHPTNNDADSGFYKVTIVNGHVTAATAVSKADITALGIPSADTGITSFITNDGVSISISGREATVGLSSVSTDLLTVGNPLVIDCGGAV